jgi:fumarate reductase flavoprotein subunit
MDSTQPVLKNATGQRVKIVVVGGGGAGLCAAIAAADTAAADGGSEVLLLEKSSHLGGDTIISDQIISAAGTKLQQEAGIADTPHQYLMDHLKGGRYKSDLVLAATLIQSGAAAWDWLADKGCQFPSAKALHVQHDHSIARSVKLVPPGMIPPLKQAALARGIQILFETRATALMLQEGRVAGVKAEKDGQTLELKADGVILACGGFGRNREMIRDACPALAEAVSWSAAENTGDGITMAKAVGADVIHYPDLPLNAFRVIQCGSDVKHKVLHPTYLLAQTRSQGGILVSTDGKRFYDEMGPSSEMVQAAMARGPFYFLIFDARIATPSPWLPEKTFEAQLDSAVRDGLVAAQAPTLEELADKITVPSSALAETVARWNADVQAGQDSEFGRTEGLGKIEQPPFYALRLKPTIVQTLGGLRINAQAQVLDREGHAIPGLFAAGQVTGGVHGADYIGGSSLLELVVFGVLAGQNAVRQAPCRR